VLFRSKATLVEGADEKARLLQGMVETYFPGRWDMLRPVTGKEIKATKILSLPIEEASAKIREGGPIDDEEDYELDIWAGVIPVAYSILPVVPDPRNLKGANPPQNVTEFKIG